MTTRIEIGTSYDFTNFPAMDSVITSAVGRKSDFAGSDFDGRDLGWVTTSEFEAAKIERALVKLRLPVRRRNLPADPA